MHAKVTATPEPPAPNTAADELSLPLTKADKPAADTAPLAHCYHISGIVQGVGFRPWVYQLATAAQLTGYVLNNGAGVTIVVQGSTAKLAGFDNGLRTQQPPLARVDSIDLTLIAADSRWQTFVIRQSEQASQTLVAVSPDKSSCPDCLREIRDPHNRHFGYPFTNCTHCGPRYTLIKHLPYDRHNTAMAAFTMCDDCRRAYEDPLDRRYHAQPVSCPQCGPQLRWCNPQGEVLAQRQAALEAAVDALKQGKILAIKGLGGFHLVCDASQSQAVAELRRRKQRPAKPLAVMVTDITMAQHYAVGCDAEWQLLSSQERPIVLLQKMPPAAEPNTGYPALSEQIAPGIDRIGLFLPYTPLHTLLLDALQRPLVATSANLSGEPIITDGADILARLATAPFAVIDAMLDHNRPIVNGCDDSVVQLCHGELQVLRLARGYAPLSLPSRQLAQQTLPAVLGVGPQQKNTLALNIGHTLYLSPHIGDLFSVAAEGYFQRTLDSFHRLYHFTPQLLVRDKHPHYAPSRWAEQQPQPVLTLQHHYAHVLATMAANDYDGPVLGFSFDGTGLGDDGELWGGELLLADNHSFQRLATLQPFQLLGNEQAIRQPWRLALALLLPSISVAQLLARPLPALQAVTPQQLHNLAKIFAAAKMPKSHSVGRLFDALAVLLGLMQDTLYEGQAGILLESAARSAHAAGLSAQAKALGWQLPLQAGELPLGQWQCHELFAAVASALWQAQDNGSNQQENRQVMALAFMYALGDAIVSAAILARQRYGVELPVVLTGGVFQNRFLSEYCRTQLANAGIRCLPQGRVPVNDGGIALGQLWYGLHNHGSTKATEFNQECP